MHVLHLRVDAGQGRGELLQRRRIDCERCHRRFVLDRKWEYVTPGQLMEERMASSVCWYWVPALASRRLMPSSASLRPAAERCHSSHRAWNWPDAAPCHSPPTTPRTSPCMRLSWSWMLLEP